MWVLLLCYYQTSFRAPGVIQLLECLPVRSDAVNTVRSRMALRRMASTRTERSQRASLTSAPVKSALEATVLIMYAPFSLAPRKLAFLHTADWLFRCVCSQMLLELAGRALVLVYQSIGAVAGSASFWVQLDL